MREELSDIGFESCTEFVVFELEKELANQAKAEIDTSHLWLAGMFGTSSPLPDPLPDVIGTKDNPGALRQEIDAYFEKLEKEIEEAKTKCEILPGNDGSAQKNLAELQNILAKRQEAWKKFADCFENKPKLQLFAEDPAARAQQYLRFAYQLSQTFEPLKTKNLEAAFFSEDGGLTDFPSVCYTGWHNRTEGLLTLAGLKKSEETNPVAAAHILARDLRRSFTTETLLRKALELMGTDSVFLRDVHYRQAAMQVANERLSLCYTAQELDEEEPMKLVLDPHITKALEQIQPYSSATLIESLQSYFADLKTDDRESFIQTFVDFYQTHCQQDESLLLDPLILEGQIYEKLKEANHVEDKDERIKLLKDLSIKLEKLDIQIPLRSLQETLEQDLRSLSLPWTFQAFKQVKELPENDRGAKFKSIFQELAPEKQTNEARLLIDKMCESSTKAAQEAHLKKQKATIDSKIDAFPDVRLRKNGQLFAKKIATDKTLEPFGAVLWAVSAKLLKESQHPLDAKLESILKLFEKRFSCFYQSRKGD